MRLPHLQRHILVLPHKKRLVFEDHFDGSSLNLGNWQPNWLAGDNVTITKPAENTFDASSACMDPAQVTVSNSICTLTTVASPFFVNGHTYNNRSGLINSNGKFNYTYGYIEARIKLQASSGTTIGNWPAFWTDGQSWPDTAENDVIEGLGGTAKSTYHYNNGGTNSTGSVTYDGDNTTDWHVWGSLWLPGYLDRRRDGIITSKIITPGVIQAAPHYLILDLSMGGSGGPDIVGGNMQIDWVRAYAPQ